MIQRLAFKYWKFSCPRFKLERHGLFNFSTFTFPQWDSTGHSVKWQSRSNVHSPSCSNKQSEVHLVGTQRQFCSSTSLHFKENHDSKALALLDNVKQVRHSPVAALVLGFAGLIPLVAAPSYIIYSGVFLSTVAYAQLAYGASILSFIGGVRWGLTLAQGSTQNPDWHNLGYGIVPALIAWSGLLVSQTMGSLAVISGLALTGYMDIAMWGYPNWFKGLRFCLTIVAILSLWTTLVCHFLYSEQRSGNDISKNKG